MLGLSSIGGLALLLFGGSVLAHVRLNLLGGGLGGFGGTPPLSLSSSSSSSLLLSPLSSSSLLFLFLSHIVRLTSSLTV